VVKAVGLAHKTDVGGVRLNLWDADAVKDAAAAMAAFSQTFLVERMVEGVVAEVIVGVARDPQFGPHLLIGAGGVWVEMMKDSVPLLLPTSREEVLGALSRLKMAPLLNGFRGKPAADVNAAAEIVLAVAKRVERDPSAIVELDINPLMLLADGRGAVAADALIRLHRRRRRPEGVPFLRRL
jgi:acetyl-CoA synthetase